MKLKNLFTLFLASCAMGASAQTIVSTTPTNKNIVLEELTGVNCGYCPDGHRIGQLIYDNNPGRVVLLNNHTGGYANTTPDFRVGFANYVGGLYSVSGYPTGSVNRTDFGGGVMHSRGQWTANATSTMAQTSPVNVGATGAIDLDNGTLTLNVEAYYTAAGTGTSNKFHAVILQNNVPGPQSGASLNPAGVLPNGDYNHQHMVRHNLTPNAGDNIAAIAATDLYTNTYTYTIPATYGPVAVNLADLEIAVFVSEAAATAAVVSGNKAALSFTTTTALGATNTAADINAELGAVCGTDVDATMAITNMGNTALTTATIQYTVNGGTPGTVQYTFTNPLATGQYEDATITVPGLSPNGASSTVDLAVTMLNGQANPGTNVSTGHSVASASMQSATSTNVTFALTTDRYGSETTWELVDETAGSVVMQGGPYANLAANGQTVQTPVSGVLVDGHCYKLLVNDSYGDGICCTYGNGSFSLDAGGTTFSSGAQFTGAEGIKFVFDYAVGVTQITSATDDIRIMPNPVTDNMTLEFTVAELGDLNIAIVNALGQNVKNVANGSFQGTTLMDINTSDLASGVYFLNITSNKGTSTERFVVNK